MKTIKRLLLGLLVLVALFSLTSCIDIFQNITLGPDDTINMTVRYTVSKALFEMGESEGTIEEAFSGQVLSEEVAQTMFGKEGNREISYSVINTDSDYGAMIKVSYPKGMKNSDKDMAYPNISPQRIEIKPFIGDATQIEENDPFSMMFFSSMKYRLQFSKSILKNVKSARLQFLNGKFHDLEIIDLGDSYLFEVPLVLMMEGEEPTLIFEK